jgi:hypothetical protein
MASLYLFDSFGGDHFLFRIVVDTFELDGNVIDIDTRSVFEIIELVKCTCFLLL